MQNTLSDESKKSLNALMVRWFIIAASLVLYLFMGYILFATKAYTPPYSVELLQANLFSGMTIHAALYLVAAIIFVGTDVHSKASYKKLLLAASEQTFKTKDDEFNFFKTHYASIMFLHIAIFNSIAILGVITFLFTMDFTTLMNLVIVSLLGFVLMIPNQARLTFPVEKVCPLKK
jgi:hypothetical protein